MKKFNNFDFIERSQKAHNDKYDYSNSVYLTCDTKIEIICKKHGSFWQTPGCHWNGAGCRKCKDESQICTREQFIVKSREIHGNEYDYSRVKYIRSSIKIEIICKIHGSFTQTPNNHLRGNKCSKCNKHKFLTNNEFVVRARKTHGTLYNYSKVMYEACDIPVTIICELHGEFTQKPGWHIFGGHCKKCSMKFGRMEGDWLDSLQITDRQKRIIFNDGTYIIVDGYDQKTNTIYEFWGDAWHGNPNCKNLDDLFAPAKKTYRELYQYTQSKIVKIKEHGYNLIDMWEHDWLKRKNKSLL